MTTTRRSARELALRVLYQVDVANVPLEEALSGALSQHASTLHNVISQDVGETTAAVAALAEFVPAAEEPRARRSARALSRRYAALLAKCSDTAETATIDAFQASTAQAADARLNRYSVDLRQLARICQETAEEDAYAGDIAGRMRDLVSACLDRAGAEFIRRVQGACGLAHYASGLVLGVSRCVADLDYRIASVAAGWSVDRQAIVDRNILRIAAYELVTGDPAAAVVIDEAVEIAKLYSTEESGRFVNGVLGALANQPAPPSMQETGEPE